MKKKIESYKEDNKMITKKVNIQILGKFAFVLLLTLISFSCGSKSDQTTSDNIKQKELELKEKELQLKEKEMMDKKSAELDEKEKQLNKKTIVGNKKIDISGSYSGSIKNGTSWEILIKGFDGENFSGHDIVYWESYPQGFKTNFTGTFNYSTGEIIISEDSKAKGSGKFVGKVTNDGKSMNGDWFRYTDNGSFTWNLTRIYGE